MDTTVFLITIKSIHIQANIIDHPYGSVTLTRIPAQSPEYRFVKNIWIVRYQLHRLSVSNGVLHSQPGSFINQSKAREALFIFDSSAILFIFVPMLEVIRRVRWSKKDLVISNGEREVRLSLAVDLDSRFVGEIRGRGGVVMMNGGRQMGLKRRMVVFFLITHSWWRWLVVELRLITRVVDVCHLRWWWWWGVLCFLMEVRRRWWWWS